ncbi:eCIS core domain-containing protein [Nostoc sp.]|uniref:eCIS core domain-containing protein n=1 Tax=Nostoc sp. TaxID=1180 RepID=UPI002FF9E102
MRVPKQKHNASSKQVPQHSVVGKSDRQPGKNPQQSQLVQTLSRVGNAGNHAAILNRAPDHQQSANKNLLLHLQRQYGNSYVNQVVKQAQHNSSASTQQAPIQTKLTIGPVGDKYEREADRTAAAVVHRINAPNPVQSAGGLAIQREKMPEEELQKKPQISAIQREVMPGEDEPQAQMKPAELLQTKKPEEEDKQKQAAKKTALAAPPQPKKIKEEDKKKLLRKQAASNPSKSKKQEEDDKLKHLQKKSDAIAEHVHKEEDEDKLPVQKKSHPDAGSTKKPEEEDKLKHLQKKSDTHAEHGHKKEDEDKLSVQKKSHPGAEPHKKPEEDDKHLMQPKSEVSAGHQDKDEEDKMAQMQPLVQRRSGEGGTDATADVESAIKHARGKGRPLPHHVRSSMENAFGADFSGVKIHADTHADKLNRSIQARAFTTGQDVFFRHGEFALGSKRGQELLAHELTHVVQQNGSAVQPKSLPKQEKNKENKLQSKTKFNESAEQAAIPEQKTQGRSTHLAPTAAPADTSGQVDVQQQPLVAEAGIREIEVQRQEATVDAAPDSPEADPAYQEVVSQAQDVGTNEKKHQPAEEKSQEAQAAAKPPSNEVESKAQDKQVDEMETAPTPPFDAKAFKEALIKRIADITPKNLEEADKFKNSNKLESVKNDVTGKVDDAQKDSKDPLDEKTKAPPDTSGITPKPVTPLPPNQPGETPSINGAEKAAPKSKGQSEVEAPVQARSQSLDQQLTEADITEEQLAKSNEPQFQAALDSKKTAQTHSQTAPQAYRQGEQSQLSQAESTAAATAQEKLQGMHGERSQSLEQVTGKQVKGKGKDEQSRAKIAGDIDKIYQTTKTKVDTKLAKLTTDVSDAFDAGATEAKKFFEEYVGKRMDAYKKHRYTTSWRNPFGWAKWVHDKLFGMPHEVNRFYEEGRDLYLQKMDAVIDKVVAIVGTGLTEAKNDVADGRKQVKEYVAKLPEDLKEIGVEAAENIQTQFDGLEQEIENKQDELIDTLAQKYKENLDAVDARIKEMQEENKGLIQKAVEFIVGVIKTIIELAKLLLEVLARVASVIGSILKDPIGFLSNLFNALKQGFNNFVKNIGKYLTQGLLSWLTGALAGANIQMPTSLDAQGIFSLVIQVLGMGYDAIRGKAVKRMGKDGEEKVSHLEKSNPMFRTMATQGVAGVWQVIKERLGDIKTMVLDPIIKFLIENVIVAGVQWIIGLMSPASAFIKACKAIYDIIKFFIEHAQQIADLINSILDAVALVASGAIDKAAQAVEDSLAKALPLAIGFLASVLGLGGISQKVQSIIQKMRQPIEKAIDWVIDQGVKAYKVVEQKIQKTKTAKKAKAAKEAARKKKEADQKLINKKKEAVEKRYEHEKNKLLKSKADKKQLDALKKKRDAAKKKFDAAKNWPAKKLEALIGRKDNKQRGIGKHKAGKRRGQPDKRTEQQNNIETLRRAIAQAEKFMREPAATPETVKAKLPELRYQYRLKSAELVEVADSKYKVKVEINPSLYSKIKEFFSKRQRFNREKFKLRDWIPSTKTGKFDADYYPKTGELKITTKINFNFVDSQAYENIATEPNDTRWQEKQKGEWIDSFKTTVLSKWNKINHITCDQQDFDDIVVKPQFNIVQVPRGHRHHYKLDVTKAFTVASTGKMRAGGLSGVNLDEKTGKGTGSFQQFDTQDKIKNPKLAENEVTTNINPAYDRDRQRLERRLTSIYSIQFKQCEVSIDTQNKLVNAAKSIAALGEDSGLAHLHPLVIEFSSSSDVNSRFNAIKNIFNENKVKQNLEKEVKQDDSNPNCVKIKAKDDPTTVKANYIANWSRHTAAHEYGHMIGLLDEYYPAIGSELIDKMKKEGAITESESNISKHAETRKSSQEKKQNAYAKLLHDNELKTPAWARPNADKDEKSTSLMSGGFELLKQHSVTIWEALTEMTKKYVHKKHWKL